MGPIGCPEMPVRNDYYSLRNSTEEHGSQYHNTLAQKPEIKNIKQYSNIEVPTNKMYMLQTLFLSDERTTCLGYHYHPLYLLWFRYTKNLTRSSRNWQDKGTPYLF
jgi:hypothetical protein